MKILKVLFLSTAFYMSCVTSVTYAEEEPLTEKEICAQDTNKYWDSSLNRCMMTKESMKTRDEYKACGEKETAEERKTCLKVIADRETEDINNKSVTSDNLGTGVNTLFLMTSAYALSSFIGDKKESPCSSLMLAGATGLASVLGQTLYLKDAEDEIDDLRSGYENATAEDGQTPYSTQLAAFQFLKEEQEAIAKLAKKRKTMYYTIATGYAGALVLSATDWYKGSCENGSESGGSVDSADVGAFTYGAEIVSTPYGVAVVSALGVTWNYALGDEAGKQEEESNSNAEDIQTIIEKFEKNVAGLCPEGREDNSKPRCFCYDADYKQSANRKNSAICQALWKSDNKNYYVENKGLTAGSKEQSTRSCITNTGQLDLKCKCRNYVDEDGANACQTISLVPTAINAISGIPGVSGAVTAMDGLTNGTYGLSGLDTDDLVAKAIKAKLISDKIIRQINAKLPKNRKIRLDEKFQRALSQKMATKESLAQVAKFKKAMGSSSRPNSPAIAQALKSVEKKVSLSNLSFSKSKKRKFKKKKNLFNFDDMGSGSGGKVDNFKNAKVNYNYKENDIVNREDLSIWDVMSHRYQVSGLKRLFADEE